MNSQQSPLTLSRNINASKNTHISSSHNKHKKKNQQIYPPSITDKTLQQPISNETYKNSQIKPEYSKNNQCQTQSKQKYENTLQDSQFSIDSQFLKEQTPIQIQIQPEIQIQAKPEIDALIATNIRMNKYKETYKKIQKQQEQKAKIQKLKKLNQSAKEALTKSKPQKQPPQNKWGHTIFQNQSRKVQASSQQILQKEKCVKIIESPSTKKQNLQNAAEKANQRIKQFKQKQQQRQKQQQKKQEIQRQNKLDKKKIQQVNLTIVQNANQILKEKQTEVQEMKKKRQEIKKKINQLQKESLNNCKKSKQNPVKFEEGKQEQLKLEDSQYSTFEARKEGRKMIKKEKKKKNPPKQVMDKSKVVVQTSSRRYLKQKMTKTTPNFTKSKSSQKDLASEKQNKDTNNKVQNDQQAFKTEFKKFYVWQEPIEEEDYSLVALRKKIQQEESQKISKKQERSFKDEAEQFLRQKQMKRQQQERSKTRQELLQLRVSQKKNEILREYEQLYVKS